MSTTIGSTNAVKLYPEQQKAKDEFLEWLTTSKEPIFRIFGYAGVGKTTIVREIVRDLKGPVFFGAFTGKASLVMQRNNLPAKTIHSLIYTPVLPDKNAADAVRKEIAKTPRQGNETKLKQLYTELKENETLSFALNKESPLCNAELFVLDECSMVNDEMLADILSFEVPLLVLGDPGQLPPIEGTGALVRDKPHVLLTEIHRQALDNPIISLSVKARTGKFIPRGDYGTSRHIRKEELSTNDALAAHQIITGKNKTRRVLNLKARAAHGYSTPYPTKGDKVICLRNNRKCGLFNGLLCTVEEQLDEYDTSIEYKLITEDNRKLICRILRAHFDEYRVPGTVKSLRWWDFQEAEEFDFGYAITVHKSQGSQWDDLILYDDRFFSWDRVNRPRWLYTGITRAAEQITLVS